MRYVALLRGINVGGHRVIRMPDLAAALTVAGLERVSTFIASGNVLFDGPQSDRAQLQARIRAAVLSSFGHDIDVMVRTCEELGALAASIDPPAAPDKAYALFLSAPPPLEAAQRLKAFESIIDRFELLDLEVIWSCRRSQAPSCLSNASIEKLLGVRSTARDWNTVVRLAALCKASAP